MAALEDSTSDCDENEDILCDLCCRGGGLCTCPNTVGRCRCPPNAAPSPSCVFYSPRIVSLMEGQRTEFETAQDHWTVVDAGSAAELERVGKENRKYFDEVLVKHPEWGAFFQRIKDLEVGAKIGEGRQAEIFAAASASYLERQLVVKVWKEGVSLRDLERQWPPQILLKVSQGEEEWPFQNIFGGVFIREGELRNRFAFVMRRPWGDLRTLMDERMQELVRHNMHGPPFNNIGDVVVLLAHTSHDLLRMHEAGIVHRDIKASNVLKFNEDNPEANSTSIVIDYECSVGVTGTGFWRAPEILEQLQKRVRGDKVVFTEKADIYSFGMLCYEMITGCIPFEDHPGNDYSVVLGGKRPELPDDLDLRLKGLVVECLQHDPELRPTSSEIYGRFRSHAIDLEVNAGRYLW